MVVANVDDVRLGALEDQIVEGADLLETAVVAVEFLDVFPGGVPVEAEDLLFQTLDGLAVEGELFADLRRVVAAQERSPSDFSLESTIDLVKPLRPGRREEAESACGCPSGE